MKVFHGGFQRKMTKLLLVLAVTSQTMVSCGVRDDGDTLQVQAMEQEKATESELLPDEVYATDALDGTDIEFFAGDWEQSVTRDVQFVNDAQEAMDEMGMDVRWVSSDESVVTNEGKVTRQQEDKDVTITVNVIYKGKEYKKTFSFTVKKKNTIDVNSLEDYSLEQLAEMNNGDEDYEVETNESGYVSYIYGTYSDIKVDSWETALATLYNIRSLLGIGDIAGELQIDYVFAGGEYGYVYRFSQIYKGLEVLGCTVVIDTDENDKITALNSHYFPIPKDMDITPKVTRKKAGKKAEHAGYGKFIPGGEESEDGKLCIFNDDGTARLVWYLICEKDAWWDQYIVLVDAKTGEIVYADDGGYSGSLVRE